MFYVDTFAAALRVVKELSGRETREKAVADEA